MMCPLLFLCVIASYYMSNGKHKGPRADTVSCATAIFGLLIVFCETFGALGVGDNGAFMTRGPSHAGWLGEVVPFFTSLVDLILVGHMLVQKALDEKRFDEILMLKAIS